MRPPVDRWPAGQPCAMYRRIVSPLRRRQRPFSQANNLLLSLHSRPALAGAGQLRGIGSIRVIGPIGVAELSGQVGTVHFTVANHVMRRESLTPGILPLPYPVKHGELQTQGSKVCAGRMPLVQASEEARAAPRSPRQVLRAPSPRSCKLRSARKQLIIAPLHVECISCPFLSQPLCESRRLWQDRGAA